MTVAETDSITALSCSCGSVEVEVTGPPILTAACYCDDCQAGARQIAALPANPPVTTPDGGTPYVLYGRDRVASTKGAELLEPHKLRADSPTSRVVAKCCNTPMFVSYDRGPHWVSLYYGPFGDSAPPLDMRVNTRFKPAGVEFTDDVPSYGTFPMRFVVKLVIAKIAMMLGR